MDGTTSGIRSWPLIDCNRQARMRRFAHVQRRDSGFTGQRMLKVVLRGRRKRVGPQRRFMSGVKEVMKMVDVTEEEARHRIR